MGVKDQKISQQLQDKVNRELMQDEQVVWADKPVPQFSNSFFWTGVSSTAFNVCVLLSMLDVQGFGLPGIKGPASLFDKISVVLMMILPLLMGVLLLFGSVAQFVIKNNKLYVITDKRVMIVDIKYSVESYYPHQLSNVSLKDNGNGLGDVVIERVIRIEPDGEDHSYDIGFLNIKNPVEVEQMMMELANVG